MRDSAARARPHLPLRAVQLVKVQEGCSGDCGIGSACEAGADHRDVGHGKSSLIAELAALGYKAVDTDDGWCEPLPVNRQRWREDAIQALLATEDTDVLFVAGCEENQVRFHAQFDHIVLLSAPVEVLTHRLATRMNNPFGKSAGEYHRFLADLQEVEPRLRAIADCEIDTTMPLSEVVRAILQAAGTQSRA